MIITTKRISISLGQEDEKKINELCNFFRETPTPAIKRCINDMHAKLIKDIKKTEKLKLLSGEIK